MAFLQVPLVKKPFLWYTKAIILEGKRASRLKDIERIIREVDSTMAMEGLPITTEDRNRIRFCLRDDSKFNKTIAELIEKHTVRP